MRGHPVWMRTLALVGAALVWLPLLAPVILALVMLFTRGQFLFDYLMPAELGLVVAAGGLLLVAAAFLSHRQRQLVCISLAAAFAALALSMAVAERTGLASGAIEMAGWPWVVVRLLLAGYWVGLIALGVGGILLARGLWAPARPVAA